MTFRKVQSRSFPICFKQLYIGASLCVHFRDEDGSNSAAVALIIFPRKREKNIVVAFYFIGLDALLRLESFCVEYGILTPSYVHTFSYTNQLPAV